MRHFFEKPKEIFPLPDLTAHQKNSFRWLLEEGIEDLLEEVNPIEDYTGRGWKLSFSQPRFEEPSVSSREAQERDLTYSAPWYLQARLRGKKKLLGEDEIYMGEFPMMTKRGTFIINGVEQVVASQLTRSEGIYFSGESDPETGLRLSQAKLVPKNGAWLLFLTSKKGPIFVRINRGKKVPFTLLLRVFGLEKDEEIKKAFSHLKEDAFNRYILSTLEGDETQDRKSATLSLFRAVRPGERVVKSRAQRRIKGLFFDPHRFDLGSAGRFKLNQLLDLSFPVDRRPRLLHGEDLIKIIQKIIKLNLGEGAYMNVDHLGNRRARLVGELTQEALRRGFLQMTRNIRGRMSTAPKTKPPTPKKLISSRPVNARLLSFFATAELSQYHDQMNPLASLSHLRRLTSKGPGGLTQKRASFSARDAHYTHYGRICPIETPEGPNIGLTTYMALYAHPNKYGFLEAPLFRISEGKVTGEVVWLAPWDEEEKFIAPASVKKDQEGNILEDRIPLRRGGKFFLGNKNQAQYLEVSPKVMLGVSASLIPFIAHDASGRALMSANMARQAVPLIRPQPPLVGTGMEKVAARAAGSLVLAQEEGKVTYADASRIVVKGKEEKEYKLKKFQKSNDDTSWNQKTLVKPGQKIKKGGVLAEGPSTKEGELSLGTNLKIAYLPFEGLNYEDAVVVSEKAVREDLLTSVHIYEYSTSVLETKLGPEELTADIPNVPEKALRNLDEGGIVVLGSKVESGDILVGKVAPRGKRELSAEERLLRAVFGEKARDVRDNSLYLPHGKYGSVIGIKVLTPENSALEPGVIKEVKVFVAQRRKVAVGDKLVGRHGNKGVISKIVPLEDMPFLEDGTPIDIIISPLSVISRMNLGQLFEAHLGAAGEKLEKHYALPPFSHFEPHMLEEELKKAGLPVDGKRTLFNGKTGEPFSDRVVVGSAYILKLKHLSEDKMHARSTGPYNLITQQPLGGKARFGGQRFGEMEAWALEAHGVPYTLQEMLTIKSDDVQGRNQALRAMIQGKKIPPPTVPESLKLMVRELNGLGLEVEPKRRTDV